MESHNPSRLERSSQFKHDLFDSNLSDHVSLSEVLWVINLWTNGPKFEKPTAPCRTPVLHLPNHCTKSPLYSVATRIKERSNSFLGDDIQGRFVF